ncbi:MAG: hypothetical protein HY606_06685 [Planctomycetes bacterium]|nr:hypothetical protein [Planctomycetota bacterium]
MKLNRQLFEPIVFTGLFLLSGFLFNAYDPLLTNSIFSYSVLFLAIITLFYGFIPGLLVLATFSVVAAFGYKQIPYLFLFENCLFTLVFGEFHLYWTRTLKKSTEEKKYYGIKLKELSKAFYSLKISHDQLEKNYILKPISIRSLLEQTKSIYLDNKRDAFNELLKLFARFFGIENAVYYKKIGDAYMKTAWLGNDLELDQNDTLVSTAIEEGVSTYINIKTTEKDYKGKYLAVIPAISGSDEIEGLLLINKMSFMSFNKNNLEMIGVIMSYYSNQTAAIEACAPVKEQCPFLSEDLIAEMIRLSHLRVKYGLESMIAFICVPHSYLRKSISSIIEQAIRGSEIHQKIEMDDRDILIIIMPLAGSSTINGFVNRISDIIKKKCNKEETAELMHARIIEIESLDKTIEILKSNVNSVVSSVHQN